ncbi:MAG: hypothetical protein AAGJ10_15770, partial [Bacteroidota bacterium]
METFLTLTDVQSQYVWDARLAAGTGAYRHAITGRVVSSQEVRAALDRVLDAASGRANTLAVQLR